MATRTLSEFFQPHAQRIALDAYTRFADGAAWSIPAKLKLYRASRNAFSTPGVDDAVASANFETIYNELRGYWQIFRSSVPGEPWSARRVYDTLRAKFADFAWEGAVSLPTLWTSGKHHALLFDLMEMKDLKPNAGYPDMAVSKFLHFYNPGLFPIYDTEVIWRIVFKRFRADYTEFSESAGLTYRDSDATFLRNYFCWASALMSNAHPDFMAIFSEWLARELSPRQVEEFGTDKTSLRLYATAFEFTVIGAATLSS